MSNPATKPEERPVITPDLLRNLQAGMAGPTPMQHDARPTVVKMNAWSAFDDTFYVSEIFGDLRNGILIPYAIKLPRGGAIQEIASVVHNRKGAYDIRMLKPQKTHRSGNFGFKAVSQVLRHIQNPTVLRVTVSKDESGVWSTGFFTRTAGSGCSQWTNTDPSVPIIVDDLPAQPACQALQARATQLGFVFLGRAIEMLEMGPEIPEDIETNPEARGSIHRQVTESLHSSFEAHKANYLEIAEMHAPRVKQVVDEIGAAAKIKQEKRNRERGFHDDRAPSDEQPAPTVEQSNPLTADV